MSSARSVASARAKRAGLSNEPMPNKSNLSNNIKQNNSSETITIPNAITLITLRLGKLETYIQNLETDVLPTLYNQTPNTSSSEIVSSSINNKLEEQINNLSLKISQVELENVTLKNKLISLEERIPQVQEINNEIMQIKNELQKEPTNILPQVEEINNEIIKIKDLQKEPTNILPQVQEINNEIAKMKDLLMYLQHSSLEVNEKIIHILFNNMNDVLMENIEVEEEEEEEEEEEVVEVVQEIVQEVVQEIVQEVVQEIVQEIVQEVVQEEVVSQNE